MVEGNIMFSIVIFTFILLLWLFLFFVFDETILKGYFATKLRKRFNVEDLK